MIGATLQGRWTHRLLGELRSPSMTSGSLQQDRWFQEGPLPTASGAWRSSAPKHHSPLGPRGVPSCWRTPQARHPTTDRRSKADEARIDAVPQMKEAMTVRGKTVGYEGVRRSTHALSTGDLACGPVIVHSKRTGRLDLERHGPNRSAGAGPRSWRDQQRRLTSIDTRLNAPPTPSLE